MILVDTSAIVEYMRGGGGPTRTALRKLIAARTAAITEPVAMELLAGARDRAHERSLQAFLAGMRMLPVAGFDSWESAARVYRACRSAGRTPRSQLDCLIAAVAIREEIAVLHADRDFDLIAQHTPLRVASI